MYEGPGNLDNLTLRHIRLFLAAARFENFSTAARYMYMTQPMVSRIIAGLERDLGLALFFRDKKKVSLTPAGRALQQAWGELMEQAEAGVQRAQEVQQQGRRRIRIGNDRNADRDLYFYPILSAYIRRNPDLEIEIDHEATGENIEKLRSGKLDFLYAMLYDAPGLDEATLSWKVLQNCPLIVFVPPSSPLYACEKLDPRRLQEEQLLLLGETAESGHTAAVNAYLRRMGLQQGRRIYLSSLQSINYNLYQGKGVFIGTPFLQLLHREEFKAFPLPDSREGLIAVWRRADNRPELMDLIQTASVFFETGKT